MQLDDYLFQTIEKSDFLSGFVVGHLVLESLMKKAIAKYDSGLGNYADKLKFSGLVGLCFEIGIFTKSQQTTMASINKMRNKLAHNLEYKPTRQEIKELFELAKSSFSDMTDGLSQGIDTLNDPNWKHEIGDYTLSDLFIQIAYDLDLFDQCS
ncbi:hypothetical protein [Vibrio neptunius]|uniref:DUF4145 domain-containing protein n=1 Tax=Vibrio neptunius TaxID=170651 RepID=A0ABS3A5J8_9VIBR|nr:hypothetical protein [Vibrio neptunius]MBN3494751.1 hypothetical protein [Vibrio neptunius]MBN3517103.1 hypothetical protein [Vibrio neptunius]MBN3551207.1 hypothetical protein [Vibrio neptunius]MBN3579499.1 hypothetical protein [Vibrio neptunius]MCH9873164.1 hypothetical protein [Vibrio neptunius]